MQQTTKYILFLIFILQCGHCNRIRRYLIHPDAKIQLIIGLGIPVSLEDTSVTLGYSLRAFYPLPSNTSVLLNPVDILQITKRNLPIRVNIYKILANILQRFGGKSCVLKSICEITGHNLKKGLMEELFNYIFRPSIKRDGIPESMDREYIAAENIGHKMGGSCKFLYPECEFSFIDLFVKRNYKIINNTTT